MSASSNPCQVAIERLLGRQLGAWNGLPTDCKEDDLEARFRLRPGEGSTHLGSERIAYRFRVLESASGEAVRLLFQAETLRMVRMGLWSTDRVESDRLLEELGQPLARLELAFGLSLIPEGEWVYASRGLTLSVIPETGLIPQVTAYPPCTVQSYLERLHDASTAREFPAP